MNRNTQKIESKHFRDDGYVEVVDVWKTIQGEGPFTGKSAVFVRMAGCNILCPGCDSDYTTNRRWEVPIHLSKVIDEMDTRLVVLTGGEPFRQNIWDLVRYLNVKGKIVQIETNGTIWTDPPETEYFTTAGGEETFSLHPHHTIRIVCSPKTSGVHKTINRLCHDWKYVIKAGHTDPEDGLPNEVLGRVTDVARPPELPFGGNTIYIQPMDEGDEELNKKNVQAAVDICLKFDYILSLQTHKIIGMP